jgi:hypothetical protein
VNWKSLVAACWIGAGLAGAPPAFGDEAPQPAPKATPPPAVQQAPQPAPLEAPPPELSPTDKFLNNIKHPIDWFTWGADLRVREEFEKNDHSFDSHFDDEVNQFRLRGRIWADLGTFFSDPSLGIPNGLDLYVRLTDETRFYLNRPTNPPWGGPLGEPPYRTNPAFNEIIVDNLYANWDRPAGLPVSIRAGRQDLWYGRGFVMGDATPLDGSRSVYSDAVKLTLHADPIKTDLDLFVVDNKANENRFGPIVLQNGQEEFVSAYDTKMLGAYMISKYFAPLEADLYYLYKDDSLANYDVIHQLFFGQIPNGRTIHTVGGLVQGTAGTGWDYYGEAAWQYGSEDAIAGFNSEETQQGYGINSDLGYTLKECPMTPRLHGGYEDLSGDDPHSKTFGGWDPVFGTWPQISEIWAYRWEAEGKVVAQTPAEWSNLQAFSVGGSAKPMPKMTVTFDYSLMLANEKMLGVAPTAVGIGYGKGYVRGSLVVAKLLYDFNAHVSGHLWAEYFIPGDYYAPHAADAVFLRWELMFKL